MALLNRGTLYLIQAEIENKTWYLSTLPDQWTSNRSTALVFKQEEAEAVLKTVKMSEPSAEMVRVK